MRLWIPIFVSCLHMGSCSKKLIKCASLLNKGVSPVGTQQELYVNLLHNKSVPILVTTGPAGSGKTLLACDHFARGFMAGNISRLVLTRPYVAVDGEELGFLPGNIQKKMEPWTNPVFDVLSLYFSQTQIDSMIKQKTIDIVPLGFMRGRTFHTTMVLADEMQNASPSQMLMLMTRLGRESKLVITGDVAQSDLTTGTNGLIDLVHRLHTYPHDDIQHIEFTTKDIQRSLVVARILTSLYNPSHSFRPPESE